MKEKKADNGKPISYSGDIVSIKGTIYQMRDNERLPRVIGHTKWADRKRQMQ